VQAAFLEETRKRMQRMGRLKKHSPLLEQVATQTLAAEQALAAVGASSINETATETATQAAAEARRVAVHAQIALAAAEEALAAATADTEAESTTERSKKKAKANWKRATKILAEPGAASSNRDGNASPLGTPPSRSKPPTPAKVRMAEVTAKATAVTAAPASGAKVRMAEVTAVAAVPASGATGATHEDSQPPVPSLRLESSAELAARATALLGEAAHLEAKAEEATQATLPRRLGRALSERMMKTPGSGTKEKMSKLLREFDANGDGQLQRIEVRLMVRNQLKISADNAEIDAFFSSVDVDNSGEIDGAEFVAACHALQMAADEAADEAELSQERASHLRARAAKYETAAVAMAEFEAEDARVEHSFRGRTQGAGAPFELQLGAAVCSKVAEHAASERRDAWPDEGGTEVSLGLKELLGTWDTRGKGTINRQEWQKLLGEMKLGGSSADREAAERFFAVHAKSRGGIGISDELDLRSLAKASSKFTTQKVDDQSRSATLIPLREAALALQESIVSEEHQSFMRHKQSFKVRHDSATAAAAAREEAKQAKEMAERAKKAKKAEEKKQFEQRVASKRQGSAGSPQKSVLALVAVTDDGMASV